MAKKTQKKLRMPDGCLCFQCKNYENCLAMSQKIFSSTSNSQTPKALEKALEKLVKDDPLTAVCSFGGFFLGAAFSEWLKKTYKPRKRRRLHG